MSRDELTREYNQLIEQRQSMWANADEMSKRELSTEESATLAKCVDDIRQMDARIATLENEIGNTEDQSVEAPADIVESVRSLPPTPKPIVARAPAYVRDYSDRNFTATRTSPSAAGCSSTAQAMTTTRRLVPSASISAAARSPYW